MSRPSLTRLHNGATRVRGAGAWAVLLLCATGVSGAEERSVADTLVQPALPPPMPVVQLPIEAGWTDSLLHALQRRVVPGPQAMGEPLLDHADSVRRASAERMQTAVAQFRIARTNSFIDVESQLRLELKALGALIDRTMVTAELADEDVHTLDSVATRWERTSDALGGDSIPRALIDRAHEVSEAADSALRTARERRAEQLLFLDRCVHVREELAGLLSQAFDARERLRRADRTLTRASGALPVADADASVAGQLAQMREVLAARHERVMEYLRVNGTRIALLVALLALSFWAAFRAIDRATRRQVAPDVPSSVITLHQKPAAIALLTLLGVAALAPPAPVAFYDYLFVVAPLLAVLVARDFLTGRVRTTVVGLAIALTLWSLRTLVETVPWLFPWYVLVIAASLGGAILLYLRGGRWSAAFVDGQERSWVRAGLWVAVSILLVAIVLDLAGYLAAAETLLNGVLGSLGWGIVCAAVRAVLYRLSLTILSSPSAQWLRVVSVAPDMVRRGMARATAAFSITLWALGSLTAFDLLDDLVTDGRRLAGSVIRVGELTVSMHQIVLFITAVAITWLVVSVVRFILEREILPRLRLADGVPYAVSTITRYTILLCGLWVALRAAGVDLSKVTLLAGALGVGIGFGLQNIVNNFVSGLILLFERPIRIGDLVEMDDMDGTVKRIGIRSSTIKMPDGSEAVVPNGDLIAKEVRNWTLSDRRRRVQIMVSVPYGSPIETVRTILVAAAAEEPRVWPDPLPLAVLNEIGPSSMDFVLFFWVARAEDVGTIADAVRGAVLTRLAAESIEIPAPRRDIRLRDVASLRAPGAAEERDPFLSGSGSG